MSTAGVVAYADTSQSPSQSQTVAPLQYTPLEPLPFIHGQLNQVTDIPIIINGFFKLLLAFGTAFAVLMLVFYGISYMTSEVAGKKTIAKERVQGALFGLLLLLGAWIILHTINPDILNISIVLPTTSSSSQPNPGGNSLALCDGNTICADGNNDTINTAVSTWNYCKSVNPIAWVQCIVDYGYCSQYVAANEEGKRNENACFSLPGGELIQQTCEQVKGNTGNNSCADVPYFEFPDNPSCGIAGNWQNYGPATLGCVYQGSSGGMGPQP